LFLCGALAACSDDSSKEAVLVLDAGTTPAQDASVDARVSIDGGLGLDAALPEAGKVDAGYALCRIASREFCGIADVLSITRGDVTCAGDTPVFCHPYWTADGDAGVDFCAVTTAGCNPLPSDVLRMTFSFECDDTNDCAPGLVCSGRYSKPFNQVDGTSCKPDCVDHGNDSFYVQLCTEDCECGPDSYCRENGTCFR
jgi:hypothetical protein